MYNSNYKCNNMPVMASVVLTYSWLKLIDMLLLIVCTGTCICTYDIDVFNPERSSLHAIHWSVVCRKVCMLLSKHISISCLMTTCY